MHLVIVAVGLALLIGLHELVVRIARRAICRPWAVLLGIPAGYLVLVGFAFALYASYGFDTGRRDTIVDEAMPGYDTAGKLERGDRIVAVDGVALEPTSPTLGALVEASGGKPVVLTIERAGARRDVTIQPKRTEIDKRTVWLLGVSRTSRVVRVHDTGAAVKAAALYPIHQTRTIAVGIRELIAGREQADPGGPLRIVEEFRLMMQPALQLGLQMLLVFGVYAWLALCVLDLVRLVQLARQPPARSSAS